MCTVSVRISRNLLCSILSLTPHSDWTYDAVGAGERTEMMAAGVRTPALLDGCARWEGCVDFLLLTCKDLVLSTNSAVVAALKIVSYGQSCALTYYSSH